MMQTKEKLTEIFTFAVRLFNEAMDEEYEVGDQSIMLRFFTPENGIAVYEEFCNTYFPSHLKENYRCKEKYEGMAAEAFVSGQYDGVMIRMDLSLPEAEWLQIFAHEIAHIFCTRNEMDGVKFYDTFCDAPDHSLYGENNSKQMNGVINAGYAIWREMIAHIISVETTCEVIPYRFTKKMVTDAYAQIQYGNPDSKRAASNMLSYAMLRGDKETDFEGQYPDFDKSTVHMLQLVRDKLHTQPFFQSHLSGARI